MPESKAPLLEKINSFSKNTLIEQLGILITDVEEGKISGKMPVDKRTVQPFLNLHGGSSVALAETLGSIGSSLLIDNTKFIASGIEVNASHIKSASSGWVYGEAICIRKTKLIHFWEIRIQDELQNLICISRLTVAIIPLIKDAV